MSWVVSPPKALRMLYPGCTWRMDSDHAVYLTFDDGPTPGVTDRVLDILQQNGAKATFFVLGKNVEAHPKLFQRILNEGHQVGNHTHNHCNGWETSTLAYLADFNRAALHIPTHLFRPPYGRIRRAQLKRIRRSHKVVMWDVLSGDYQRNATPEICLQRVMKHLYPGSVVVFHDSLKAATNVLGCLPEIISKIKLKGYEMLPLP
jgi:peptidoglycan/xylan/chitin deacetylase (PgdA/CDA1 family)